MSGNPWFKFFPSDWRSDVGLRSCSSAARGLWIDMLCLMHESGGASVGTLTTGIDWDVRCIILARPTKSEMLFVQIVGRGLRTAGGKDDCLILDHSDNHLRLGFVTDIHHDRLDDGRGRSKSDRKAPEALPKECPKCAFLKPPKVHECPSCGFKPERQPAVRIGDGELLELSQRRAKSIKRADRQEKQKWWSMLLFVGLERGYRRGWAFVQFMKKFGEKPSGLMHLPIPADQEVCDYVRYLMIRFAKSRKAA